MSDKNNSLEEYLARKFQETDPIARRTRGSGSHTEIGDIQTKNWFVEAKIKHNHENIIADRDKEIIKLKSQIPINTQKECLWAYENKYGERYILLDAETFFKLIKNL